MNIELLNVYCRQSGLVRAYKDIFLETSVGVLKLYVTDFRLAKDDGWKSMEKLLEIDGLRKKYGQLEIEAVRRTYDNDIYLLISGKFFLVIEYVLNSSFEHSIQEFRIIEDIHGSNKTALNDFIEMDMVTFPPLLDQL